MINYEAALFAARARAPLKSSPPPPLPFPITTQRGALSAVYASDDGADAMNA